MNCPSCGGKFKNLKTLPSKEKYKWYEVQGSIKICPCCGKKLTFDKYSQYWLLGISPLIYLMLDKAFNVGGYELPYWVLDATCIFSLICILIYVATRKLEVAND